MKLHVGQRCRLAHDNGVNEEMRGQMFEVRRVQGKTVHGYARSGPASGSTYQIHVDEIARCSPSNGPFARARRRRR